MPLSSPCSNEHGIRRAVWFWRQHQMPGWPGAQSEYAYIHLQLSTVLSFSGSNAIMKADAGITVWTLLGFYKIAVHAAIHGERLQKARISICPSKTAYHSIDEMPQHVHVTCGPVRVRCCCSPMLTLRLAPSAPIALSSSHS